MRVKYIIILLAFSCSIKEKNDVASLSEKDSIQVKDSVNVVDSFTLSSKNIEEKEIQITEGSPKITPLSFCSGSDSQYSIIEQLVKKSKNVYRLPPIKKWFYFFIASDSSEFDVSTYSRCTNNGYVDTSIFNFKKYRYRLPDIYQYQSYIVCDTIGLINYGLKRYSALGCQEMYSKFHAYLILYNPITQEGKLISLHYPHPSMEGNQRRTFCIDKNFTIQLQDYGISYEKDEPEEIPTFTYTIRILPDGDIKLKSINPK